MNDSPKKLPNKSGAGSPIGNHRSRAHRTIPMGLRTKVIQHVAGFAVLFIFFMFSGMYETGKGGTLSDWSVIFYVILALIAYASGFYVYPIVQRAWQDSKS